MAGDSKYDKVFGALIDAMEKGDAPWVRGWNAASGMPRNIITGRHYTGGNVVALWVTQAVKSYPTALWATFNQISAAGGRVNKGEKATAVYFMSRFEKKETQVDGTDKSRYIPFARLFFVFNVAQTSGMDAWIEKRTSTNNGGWDGTPEDAAEAVVVSTGAHIDHAEQPKACYLHAPVDKIQMPLRTQFKSAPVYYGTLFHELVHWTGDSTRLDRTKGKRFADDAYAFEELVAEFGSAFLSAHFGWEMVSNSGAYLKHWAAKARQHPDMLASAASLAQKAVNHILGEQAETTSEE